MKVKVLEKKEGHMAGVGTVTVVVVEKAVHDAIRDLAQRVWDQHHIRLDRVCIDWVDNSTRAKADIKVMNIEATTVTRG